MWSVDCHLLDDVAAHGEAEQVDDIAVKVRQDAAEEGDDVGGEPLDGELNLSPAVAQPGVDKLAAAGGEGVDEGGIPKVDVGAEVVQEEEGRRSGGRGSDDTVGKLYAVGFDEARGRSLLRGRHGSVQY